MSAELHAAMQQCMPSNFDVAGGIHQDLLNDFADAHHRANYDPNDPAKPSVYRGFDTAPELGIKKWSYDIQSAAEFDLAPLEKSAKDQKFLRWIASLPEFYSFSKADRQLIVSRLQDQANTTIILNRVKLDIIFDQISSNSPPPPISVKFGIRADGIIQVNLKNAFVFTPIEIDVSDPSSFDAAIHDAISAAGIDAGYTITAHGDNICYPIEALVRHIARAFLKARIGQYLINLPLPSSIDLFEGFSVTDLKTVVCNNYLGSGPIDVMRSI